MPNIVLNHYQHIAVGVICRKNYILISKRAKNVDQGNLWEFPGGKVEANETAFQALFRELNEELGIRIEQAEPLITIPFSYPVKSNQKTTNNVLLDVWIVSNFSGRPYGKENQPIKWVDKKQLNNYSFPEANQSIIHALALPDTYVITADENISIEKNKQVFIKRFKNLCLQGQSLIQLRFKTHLPGKDVLQEINLIAANYQLNLQFNSASIRSLLSDCLSARDDILKYSHFGIHLISADLYNNRLCELRKLFSGYFSASCHNEADILKANALRLDFIVISPVNKTTSHPQAKPIGWHQFEQLTKLAQMPTYALGGMKTDDIIQAKQIGAQGIAAISEFWDTTDEKEK
ncbi:MAG: Nudix family hydrolase [Pseudomonadota bacterium]